MKKYIDLCLEGICTISERKDILNIKREALFEQIKLLQECIDYIDWKQQFYDNILAGKIEYFSNLINDEE